MKSTQIDSLVVLIEASYLLFYASPCLKLKLALVVLNVLRALPQSAAIRSVGIADLSALANAVASGVLDG